MAFLYFYRGATSAAKAFGFLQQQQMATMIAPIRVKITAAPPIILGCDNSDFKTVKFLTD